MNDGQVLFICILLCSFHKLYLLCSSIGVVLPVVVGVCPNFHIIRNACQSCIIIHHAVIFSYLIENTINGGLVCIFIQPRFFACQQVDFHVSLIGILYKFFYRVLVVYQLICTAGIVNLCNSIPFQSI